MTKLGWLSTLSDRFTCLTDSTIWIWRSLTRSDFQDVVIFVVLFLIFSLLPEIPDTPQISLLLVYDPRCY